jgi:hypothetical protein
MQLAGHAAANHIGDRLSHLSHGKAAVKAEEEAAQVAPGMLVEFEETGGCLGV